MGKKIDFFLGANSPQGFASYFDELSDITRGYKSYIIKGGPGSGKSSLMKSTIMALADKNKIIERIHCSSDPDSLDGVIFCDSKISIADGTAPHILEPKYPGVFENIINTGEFWDSQALEKNKDAIVKLSDQISSMHKQSQRFLAAAHSLFYDSYLHALENTNSSKIAGYAKRIALKELTKNKGGKAIEHKRLLSAVTPQGVVTYINTAQELCDRIYLIRDEYGASSRLLLAAVRAYALQYGHEIYTCYCPLRPFEKIEHLFIPSLRLGFMTAHRYNDIQIEPYRVIHYTRFTDVEALKKKKQRLSFNRKVGAELMLEAVGSMKLAKSIHDKMEEYYVDAMDYRMLDEKAMQLKKELTDASNRSLR